MSVTMPPPIGRFCWPELCSADAADSKEFYHSLFGWKGSDLHMPEGDYTVFKLDGQGVGAMYQMKDERRNAGVLPHWNSYVAVADADETAQKATSLGGKVLTPPFDAGGDRMANLQDPTGANFCVWQVVKEPEPIRRNEVGALIWTELYTPDPGESLAFYSGLFGWVPETFEGGPMPYTTFKLSGESEGFAGMLKITAEMQGMAPQWMPYFLVENADKTAGLVRELGGQVHMGPVDIPNVGRIAMFADRQGAGFAVIKPAMAGGK